MRLDCCVIDLSLQLTISQVVSNIILACLFIRAQFQFLTKMRDSIGMIADCQIIQLDGTALYKSIDCFVYAYTHAWIQELA